MDLLTEIKQLYKTIAFSKKKYCIILRFISGLGVGDSTEHPPISWLDRVASVDYKVDDELTIQAGTPVYINSIGMHFDTRYFPDPNKFYPDRFIPENEAKIVPYSYLPFGEGPRMCIGSRFAMTILRNALASVFLNYKVESVPGAPKPEDVEIAASTIFYVPSGPLQVKFVSRT